MKKTALVSAVVLATALASVTAAPVCAEDHLYAPQEATYISNAQIGRFKTALRLNAEQARHWPAVAAALRRMRLGNRATVMAANASGLGQLVSAARPLFHTLDDEQKQIALRLVQSLGFGAFVAAL